MQGGDVLTAKAEDIAIFQLFARRGDAACVWRSGLRTRVLGQAASAGDVVGVRMGFKCPNEFEAVVA
jgi:hypothetical protein